MNVNGVRLRRATIVATALAVLALVVTGALHRLTLGTFLCAGLALGWVNAYLTMHTINRVTGSDNPSKQILLGSMVARLFGLTALAILVAWLARPNGIGIFFGLAVFHIVLITQTVVPDVKALREPS